MLRYVCSRANRKRISSADEPVRHLSLAVDLPGLGSWPLPVIESMPPCFRPALENVRWLYFGKDGQRLAKEDRVASIPSVSEGNR
jgi:hypothetical protein